MCGIAGKPSTASLSALASEAAAVKAVWLSSSDSDSESDVDAGAMFPEVRRAHYPR